MIHLFWDALKTLEGSPVRLLECGSRRQPGQPPGEARNARMHREDVLVTGLDAEPGEGVDVVADLHDLSVRHRLVGDALLSAEEGGPFDAVLICSTLEHVRRPWVVARELARVTRPGGVLYCATHQTFPIHHYPADYFRFSADALAEVFSEDAEWDVLAKGHHGDCKVVPLDNEFVRAHDWDFASLGAIEAWLLARRKSS